MSIRTTVTLDEDVFARLQSESKSRSVPFRKLLNQVLRSGLLAMQAKQTEKRFKVEPVDMGAIPGLNYDDIGGLIEYGEGEFWR